MSRSRWAYLDHPGVLAFAHRGGAADVPENTLAAFASAQALGYRYVETDVRVTADGVAVAFHDPTLDRVTDRAGRLEDLPWREVARARVGGEPLLRVEDLLGSLPGLRVNLDPKQDAAVGPLAEAVRRTASADRVGLASFSDRRIRRLRRLLGPDVCTSPGPLGITRIRLGLPGDGGHGCVQIPERGPGGLPLADARFVRSAHARGLQVHVWTVDDPADMHRLLDLGVDGLMTDRPGVLKQVLLDRGQWAG